MGTIFIVGNSEHTPDDKRCCECTKGFPSSCVCGGLIHAEFVKETWDNQNVFNYKCDKCADKFKFVGQLKSKKRKFKRHTKQDK